MHVRYSAPYILFLVLTMKNSSFFHVRVFCLFQDDSITLIGNMVDAVNKPGTPVSSLEKMATVILKSAGNLLNSITNDSPVSLDEPVYRCDADVKVTVFICLLVV